MAVYVDGAIWEWRGRMWCHLTADSEEELHRFAADLGLARAKFQSRSGRPWVDHYDVSESLRSEAVRLGALEITFREAGAQIARRRDAAR
jgi:hypothetical protein